MSIAGYLGRGGRELRISENAAKEIGARFEGPVLSGKKSLERRRAEEPGGVAGEFYAATKDYDPVLKSHCRL